MGENIHNINVMYIGNKRFKASFPLCRTIMYLLVYINDLNLQKKIDVSNFLTLFCAILCLWIF